MAVTDVLRIEDRSTPPLTMAAFALLFSALALHFFFFHRAKRDLGF